MLDPDRARVAKVLAWSVLLGLIGWVAISYAEGGIVGLMLRPDLVAADKLELLGEFFEGLGVFAPLAYVALVTVEVVVAPIPGTILYAPAGVIFGGFWGGVFSLIGNVLGAAVAFMLMRVLGRSAFERFIEHEHLGRFERRVSDHGALVVFLLRVNPLTSSDIVSYAAGATSMPTWKLLVGTTLGMAPLCFAQAYLAESLLIAFPRLIYPLLVAGLAYAVVFVWVIKETLGRAAGAAPR
ncbi:MAG: TVP38/TMEM64 family protein [Acidobacteria bacterium]|nr:TVP38/TMEM64 family protein [Acidobacteriota bacterium]